MTKPWTPERPVDAALAASLVVVRFPELTPIRSIEPFGLGWDNVAYLVNGEAVFRFPQRSIAAPLIETEGRVLPKLVGRLPLAIPAPLWIGRGDASLGYPWPFAGYRLLPGRPACRADLDLAARRRAAVPLARFLAALHAVPLDEARAMGAGPDALARTDVERRTAETLERLAHVRALGLLEADAWPERLLEVSRGARFAPREALVHGDLYSRHLLVDEAGDLAGVIDWGDVHVGHPGLDLSIAYSFLPSDARARFFEAYGPVPEETHTLARFRALFSLVATLGYGAETGDEPLVREARTGLRFLRDT